MRCWCVCVGGQKWETSGRESVGSLGGLCVCLYVFISDNPRVWCLSFLAFWWVRNERDCRRESCIYIINENVCVAAFSSSRTMVARLGPRWGRGNFLWRTLLVVLEISLLGVCPFYA